MRKVLFYLLVGVLGFAFVGCGGNNNSGSEAKDTTQQNATADSTATSANDTLSKIKERGVLRIGVFSDKPPFGFMDKDGKNAGFDVYISERIGKDLLGDSGKVQFELVEAANRVESLKADKVDIIMANFTQTPERVEVVDFAKPYMKVSLGVASSDPSINSIEALKGKTLIVNKGTTADFFFSKNHPDINLLKFDQNTEAFQALKDKRGDALAHDNVLLLAWVKENPDFQLTIDNIGPQDVIAPAVQKGNTALLDWLNNEIDTLTKEGFIEEAYKATLAPIYGEDKMSSVIFPK